MEAGREVLDGARKKDSSFSVQSSLVESVGILLLALLTAAGIRYRIGPLTALAGVALCLAGNYRPRALLVLALALTLFSGDLAGAGELQESLIAFNISDILLLCALPGLIWQARQPPMELWGRPALIYLAAGLGSFLWNLPVMGEERLSYLSGFLRTLQIVLMLPLACSVVSWPPEAIRKLLGGYLAGAVLLATWGLAAFAGGMRDGLYLLGNHKNAMGLALAMAALIAVAALTQPETGDMESEAQSSPVFPFRGARPILMAVAALCLLGLICTLSRSGYLALLAGAVFLAVARRRGRILGILLCAMVVALIGVHLMLPQKAASYVGDFSPERDNIQERIVANRQSLARFRQNWLLGDGFRARRDLHPHNLEVLLLAENGIVGTALFAWLLAAQTRLFLKGRARFRQDPLRECFCIAILACSLATLTHAQFDPYWRRGPLWLPWAGMGIVASMLRAARSEDQEGFLPS